MKQYRSDMIDYARFELIEEFLKHGIPPNKVYEATVIYLEKTHLEANEEALIKAHKRVKVRLKTEPYRYHILKYIRVPSADTAFRYTKERALVWDRILAMRDPDFVDE